MIAIVDDANPISDKSLTTGAAIDAAMGAMTAVLPAALAATAMRLHGIASRSDEAKIAAEVLRLNDAVRAGSAGRLRSGDHPQEFAALLLAAADPVNEGLL